MRLAHCVARQARRFHVSKLVSAVLCCRLQRSISACYRFFRNDLVSLAGGGWAQARLLAAGKEEQKEDRLLVLKWEGALASILNGHLMQWWRRPRNGTSAKSPWKAAPQLSFGSLGLVLLLALITAVAAAAASAHTPNHAQTLPSAASSTSLILFLRNFTPYPVIPRHEKQDP